MADRINYTSGIEVENLDTIYITGGGFVNRAFKGIGVSSAWGWNETVWGATLNRSNTFSLENIDDVDIGQVAQCQIIFPFMNIRDFIDIQQILKERYVYVNFYNVDTGKRETKEMAITGNERKKIYNFGNKVIGMTNFSIKFVATNRENEYNDIIIIYNSNGGNGNIPMQQTSYSEQLKLSYGNELTKSGKHIKEWNTKSDGTGNAYGLGQRITVWQNLELYAIWE